MQTAFWPSPPVLWDTKTVQDSFWAPHRTGAIPDEGCGPPKGDVLMPPGAVQPRFGVHHDPEGDKLKWGEWVKFQEGHSSLWYWCLKTQIRAKVLRGKIFILHTVALGFFQCLVRGPQLCACLGVPYQKRKRQYPADPPYTLLCPFKPWHVSMSLHFKAKIKFLIWRH